jgi:tetratricopeptide (TPR) repeat protein
MSEAERKAKGAVIGAVRPQAGSAAEIAALEQALAKRPNDPFAWGQLGIALRKARRFQAAISCYRRAIEIEPKNASLWSCLGNALKDEGRMEEAALAHAQAVALAGKDVTILHNCGICLREARQFKEAVALFDQAIARDPKRADIQFDRALSLLQLGDYASGFPAYESRWQLPGKAPKRVPGEIWDGQQLRGTLFVQTEQGFGDAILAARYLALVRPRVGRLILQCKPETARLFQNLGGVDDCVLADDPLPAFDAVTSLMSLPRFFTKDRASIPPPARFTPPESARARAKRLLGPATRKFKIGIVWSGSVTFADNIRRSLSVQPFLKLAEVPGVRLYSLQKGPREADLKAPGTGPLITALGPELEDFADTAAVIEGLDLIVMTDSSVAHLAGSMGRPVWNLLQYLPYWIYGADGESTPWYPDMRLFRQPRPGDWADVFAQVMAALKNLRQSARERAAKV